MVNLYLCFSSSSNQQPFKSFKVVLLFALLFLNMTVSTPIFKRSIFSDFSSTENLTKSKIQSSKILDDTLIGHETNSNSLRYKVANPNKKNSLISAASSDLFRAESRNAFLRLESSQNSQQIFKKKPPPTIVEQEVLPEEANRRIWLERHRHNHTKHQFNNNGGVPQQPSTTNIVDAAEKKVPNRNKLLTLTNVDAIQRNQTCRGDLFKHKIRMSGCEPKILINRFCHGSCASFYIPKSRSKKLKATFRSCAACVPSETDVVQVKLDCPEREEKEIYRTVMRVKKCACRNVELSEEEGDELDDEEVY